MFILLLLWTPPLLASLLAVAVRPDRRWAGRTNVVLSALSFGASVWLCGLVLARGVALGGPADLWRVDALSALLALCIAFVSMLASALGPGVEPGDGSDPAAARRTPRPRCTPSFSSSPSPSFSSATGRRPGWRRCTPGSPTLIRKPPRRSRR